MVHFSGVGDYQFRFTARTGAFSKSETAVVHVVEVTTGGTFDLYVRHEGENPASGNPTPDGSQAKPYRKIQDAIDNASPGQRIKVHAGTYHENLVMKQPGFEGAPFVLEGEVIEDGAGNITSYETVIDGDDLTAQPSWRAEGTGGVYSAKFPFEPALLTIQDGSSIKQIVGIKPESMDCMGQSSLSQAIGKLYLGSNSNYKPETGIEYLNIPQPFETGTNWNGRADHWEAMDGMWGTDPVSTTNCAGKPNDDRRTFIRLKNRGGSTNPADYVFYASRADTGLQISNLSHVHIRKLAFRNHKKGIIIKGPNAKSNIVEYSQIMHGNVRVMIEDRASENTIRHSDISMNFFGRRPGAWQGGSAPGEILYRLYKYLQGGSSSDDVNIEIKSSGNVVFGNHIHDGALGVRISGSASRAIDDTLIEQNNIDHHNSVGFAVLEGAGGGGGPAILRWNRLDENNIHIRSVRTDDDRSPRLVVVEENILSLPNNVATHAYGHADLDPGETCTNSNHIWHFRRNCMKGGRGNTVPQHNFKCGHFGDDDDGSGNKHSRQSSCPEIPNVPD